MSNAINWILNLSDNSQLLLYFSILFLFMLIEHLAHFRTVEKKKRWTVNFTMTFISFITMMVIPLTFYVAKYAENHHSGLFYVVSINWVVIGCMTLLLRGLTSFFSHYLMHKVPILWRLHRVHHLDTEMDVSTTSRFHPLELVIGSIIGIPIILSFGLPIWGLIIYEIFAGIITLFSHSNFSLPKKIEKITRYLIVTPDLHRIHHSSYFPESDSNFSTVFPIWDIIFKTFRTKSNTPHDKMKLGLEEVRDERTTKLGWLLWSPFKALKKDKE